MRFALVDDKLTEASSGLKGICPGCLEPVTAKCGEQRVHHWAHNRDAMCDGWWEPETEWHRSWKNNYPKEWQEVFLPDEKTGEKHIADVRTIHGLVIEFQHSHMDPKERDSRETFYKHMAWVVDGTRLKRDYHRFLEGISTFMHFEQKGVYITYWPNRVFPADWLNSTVPVIFDFQDLTLIEKQDEHRNTLWCLSPMNSDGESIVFKIKREDFIQKTLVGQIFTQRENQKQQQTPAPEPRIESPYLSHLGEPILRRRY